MISLPIYQIKGYGFFFRDERLGEYRSIKNPMKKFNINDESIILVKQQ